MLEFLIENKMIMIGGRVFQQPVDIAMGTNCVSLIAD
jgi:hypothetical protein